MPWEADERSPGELWIVIEAHNEKGQHHWELVRSIAYNIHVHAPYLKTKKSSPGRFWPFPWDKNKVEDKRAEALRELAERKKQRNGGTRHSGTV